MSDGASELARTIVAVALKATLAAAIAAIAEAAARRAAATAIAAAMHLLASVGGDVRRRRNQLQISQLRELRKQSLQRAPARVRMLSQRLLRLPLLVRRLSRKQGWRSMQTRQRRRTRTRRRTKRGARARPLVLRPLPSSGPASGLSPPPLPLLLLRLSLHRWAAMAAPRWVLLLPHWIPGHQQPLCSLSFSRRRRQQTSCGRRQLPRR